MRVKAKVSCRGFPCKDVDHAGYVVPGIDLNPSRISILMVSEASPPNPRDHYYARGDPLFVRTTVQAFRDAGIEAGSIQEILGRGVYLTTAVKCSKKAYAIARPTIEQCSVLLEKEIDLFPSLQAILLMGDVAIKALNAIALRCGDPRVIPAGPTYKLRSGRHHFRGVRTFPSYLQAGPSFFIEKSKRKMIAEDIAAALSLV